MSPRPRKISIVDIQEVVAGVFAIPVGEMVSQRRFRSVARPRQVAMFLARELTPKSLPDIGRRFGGRDHTTVMHAIETIERLCATDVELEAHVCTCRMALIERRAN